jgi:hypothetical protein
MCESCSPKERRNRRLTPVATLPVQRLAANGSLVDATNGALAKADRIETAEGALALYLAGQLDAGGHTGSQTAALAREYRAALDAATRGASNASSALDELRTRRAKRRGA